jgi:hypothetical protein
MLTGSLKIDHVKPSSKTVERIEVIWRNGDMVDVKKGQLHVAQSLSYRKRMIEEIWKRLIIV